MKFRLIELLPLLSDVTVMFDLFCDRLKAYAMPEIAFFKLYTTLAHYTKRNFNHPIIDIFKFKSSLFITSYDNQF